MASPSAHLTPGTLWAAIRERTTRALASGALVPIATEVERLEDAGATFLVRVVSSLPRKAGAQARAGPGAPPRNPFLPYEPALHVADVSPTHVCLLNKFNVFEHHALVVTRAFEEQESLLTLADFEALSACMAEFDALGFYNAGEAAGASQRHKHLQLVPVPLGPHAGRTPLDSRVQARTLPFVHAVAPAPRHAREAHATYLRLLESVGGSRGREPPLPYNLLTTRDWMMVVPRTRAECESISINALGFAGSLLVGDRSQLERVRALGPMQVLKDVARGG